MKFYYKTTLNNEFVEIGSYEDLFKFLENTGYIETLSDFEEYIPAPYSPIDKTMNMNKYSEETFWLDRK